MKTKVNCPYCDRVNYFDDQIAEKSETKIVFTCDYEAGGCDKDFVLIVWAEIKTMVKEIK